MSEHAESARQFLTDESRANWHDETLWWVRKKRDKAAAEVIGWESLREHASNIKEEALGNLDKYLIEFEAKAKENGIKVHWATDALEHNKIVLDILHKKGAAQIVKSKSMLTEECVLNSFLEQNGIEVIDSDLGERIIQWMGQSPSHIVMPAIHLKKKEIGEVFAEKLDIAQSDDAQVLTEAARQHLRGYFLHSKVALTGVNFAVADSGAFVVCTNEGNADMGVHLADVHIASMGIEKIIPKTEHLGVFLRLLARSATGQPITAYTSHFKKPEKDKEIHLILVDNGRSGILGKQDFWKALKCIRCGACMNTCPVFRKSGGHSYKSTIPGPIGAILSPHYDSETYGSLPFASSLCGSCSAVCPVKIDIDKQLYEWRQVLTKENGSDLMASQAGKLLRRNKMFDRLGKLSHKLQKRFPKLADKLFKTYTSGRELPAVPAETFKQWYEKNHE
jgi:L-lactate dehydrogenase complex protein LldF